MCPIIRSASSPNLSRPTPVKMNNFLPAEDAKNQLAPSSSAKVAPSPSPGVVVASAAKIQEDVKTSFSDTKKFVRQIGDVMGKVNQEFSVSGGFKATMLDAITDKKGDFDLSRSVRTTNEYSGKAQKEINSLTQKAFDGVDKLTEKAFASIDKAFTPKATISKAIGEFKQAISQSTSKWETFKAGASMAWGAVKSGAEAIASGVSKLTVGVGAFVASSGVAVLSGAAKITTAAATAVAGTVEGIGRVVVAPIARAAAETIGKVVIGTGVLVGGALGTLKNAANLGDWMGKVAESRPGKWVSEKLSTKSDKTMNSIEGKLSDLGITKSDINEKVASNKSEKGGELGVKDTMKKWFQTGLGQKDTGIMGISGALTGGKFASTLAEGGAALDASKAFSSLGTAGQAAVGIGAVAGPLTMAGCGYKIYTGVKDHQEGTKLQGKIDAYVKSADTKIEGFKAEVAVLKSENKPENAPKIAKLNEQITELNDLKQVATQERSKIGMSLKKAGIGQNALLALSGAASTTATIATFVGASAIVAATGPVGLGLAATGALVGAGVAAYKVYKSETREQRNEQLAAQHQLVESKINAVSPPSDEQLIKLNEAKSQIVGLRLEKDPKFAAEHLVARLEAKSPEAEEFVKAVFGDAVLESESPGAAIEARMPIVAGDQRATWRSQPLAA